MESKTDKETTKPSTKIEPIGVCQGETFCFSFSKKKEN